jgi:3-mercaptopyruvate sulfurtransferase SseA
MRFPGTVAAVVLLAMAVGTTARAAGDLAAVPRIKLEEFKKEIDQDKVLVIDTRGPDAYRAGHVPGALNVPLSDWTTHLPRLKASKKPIVAYCA